MRRTKKSERILQIVMGIFVIVFGIVFLFIRPMVNDNFGEVVILILAIFMIAAGPLLILVGALGLAKFKEKEKNAAKLIEDPSSLAFLTYGGNGGYKHYSAILDKERQSAKNAATNVAGVAGFIFLGVGTFSSGFNSIDCFVSKDGIILNDKEKNPGLQDELFVRYNTGMINDIFIEPDKKYTKVLISLTDGKEVILHIQGDTSTIQNDFSEVKKPKYEAF